MRDLDIRTRLQDELRVRFPDDLVRNELGLCLGETRVDVAVVNGHLHGFEIKSDHDTLTRFPTQVRLYDRVLDYSTVVCSTRYVPRVQDIVPPHWGVTEARANGSAVELKSHRRPRLNPHVDGLAVAQLLWRDEAARILGASGQRVRARETRWDLWDRLATLPLTTLQAHVRGALKARLDWPGG